MNKNIIKITTLILMILGNVCYAQLVTIGHTKSSDAKATAEIIKQVFERKRFNVATKSGSSELMFDMLAEKEIDFFVAGWLSTIHKTYWEQNKEKLIKIGILYEGAGYHLAVPNYIPKDTLNTVLDLRKQKVKGKINKISIIKSDAELLLQSKTLLNQYNLSKDGFSIQPLPKSELVSLINSLIEKQEWFVVGLRRPSFLIKMGNLRTLHDPKVIYVANANAHLLANKKSWNYIKEPMQEVLKKIEISVKAIEDLDYALSVRKMAVHNVARRWLASRPYTVEYWLEPDLE